jgi:hypothetical protein
MDLIAEERNTKWPPKAKEYRLNKLEVYVSKGNLPLLEFILAYPESSSAINLPAKIRIMRKDTSLII